MKIQVSQRDFQDENFKDIHDIIFPADVRATDLITARLRRRDYDTEFQVVRVWKLSPLGVELIPGDETEYKKGEGVDLDLTVGGQTTHFEGLVVDLAPGENKSRILGVRFSKKKTNDPVSDDRRTGSRWICSSQFDPVGIAANPAQFNDFLYLKIRDISKSGIRAITSLRNKFIVPGMELDLQISFPMTSQVSLTMTVARLALTAEGGKDYLEIGLEFTELTMRQRGAIGQYLIQFSDAESLKRIRSDGFFPTSLTKGVDYHYIKSESDFLDVLQLRFNANQEVGKIPDQLTVSDMADIYDTRGRIIVGKYRGKIVGTARLTFNELGDRMEHEEYVQLPPDFPRREQVLECARAATNPEFRGSDLWNTLIQHIAIVAVQAKRNWVVLSTTPELIGMYLRIGFIDTKIRYEHTLYPGKEQCVLIIDVPEVVMGNGVGPIYWNVIWRDVARYLRDHDVIRPSHVASSRLKLYSLLKPLSEVARYFARRPRKAQDQSA
jgi:predicted GNAT family N-acyltransferase